MNRPLGALANRTSLGRILVVAGAVGMLGTLTATVVGVRLLGTLDTSLEQSVAVTADAVAALAETVGVADALVGDLASTLTDSALAARAAAGGAEAAVEVLDGAATLTGQDVAGSLSAVDRSLPALIDVASVIDSTLGALDRLPLGPTYDPEVPFDDALREVQSELDGLPEALREEADLLADGADELADVGRAARFLADDLDELARTLRDAGDTLDDVSATADEAARVLGDGSGELATGLTFARALAVVLGLALAVGQLVPLGAGWLLLHPERFADVLGPGSTQGGQM